MSWFPLINLTHYSLQKAYTKPVELVAKCAAHYPACGIADYKSISGAVEFFKACKSKNIKPVIGCSFDGFSLFAKNKDGWFDLIRIVSSLDADNNYELAFIQKICDNDNLFAVIETPAISPKCKDSYPYSAVFPKSYYCEPGDAMYHRILLTSGLKKTLRQAFEAAEADDTLPYSVFFTREGFHVPTPDEIDDVIHYGESLDQILELVEDYQILRNPILPKFPTPGGVSEEDYLRELCREGWRNILVPSGVVKTEEQKTLYAERFKMEFEVIKKANLFGYFLIVQDVVNWVKKQGWKAGPGRGSAAGCLISYLVGITDIDPIEFDLIFERFYNEGRNTDGNISLPDIDIDVPAGKRDLVIAYLRSKYGEEYVSQMLTYGRLQGRSVMKEVLRAHAACGFDEMNEITKHIPDEAAISDQLEAMDEEDRSIIRWALLNNGDKLIDYCYINENGELEGDYAEYFRQAIAMEGTFKSQGKHAAGVVISAYPLHEFCPMVNQKHGPKIAGLEMEYLEAIGGMKLDVLGLSLLDKAMYIEELVKKKGK